MSKDSLRLVLPDSLTPESDRLRDISPRREKKNKACHFLSHLYTAKTDQRINRPYVPVSSQIARSIYRPATYAEIRKFLQGQSIIETDNFYRVGNEEKRGHCKGFRIHTEIKGHPIICEIQDKSLIRNLHKQRQKIILHYSKAIARMETDLRFIGLPQGFNADSFIANLPLNLSLPQQAYYLNSIAKVSETNTVIHNTITKGGIGGRYFHKINNCPRPLRKCL